MRLQVRMRLLSQRPSHDDDALGHGLVELLTDALARRGAPATAVVVRPQRLELVGLQEVRRARIPLPGFLAGLTRSVAEGVDAPLAVGLVGRLLARRRGDSAPPAPTAHVFLEWPDNRWWHWRALLGAEGDLVDDTATLRRAVDGDALPAGLGRWWSRGRRTGARLRMGALVSQEVEAPPQVH